MIEQELHELIQSIQDRGCEEQTTEVKSAHQGCPEKLYDTISAFSNQSSGGTLVFGLDAKNGFAKVGVYDAQDLQKKVMEYCEQMTPVVRPVFTVWSEDELVFVSAEIPPVDLADRPCFKTAKGRMQGSYVRVGDADKPMTEYEIYSYEAFRKKYRDDIRPAEGASQDVLDQKKVEEYMEKKRQERPNLANMPEETQMELTGIVRGGRVTMTALLLFGLYPQAYYPQLSILATSVPGEEVGDVDDTGNRFLDTKRIEGTIPDMLDEALAFVRKNMRTATKIDAITGSRTDTPQYPMDAIREAVLNALVHRDYSFHTEGMPIQLTMYVNRLEITNPGGLYGRITVDQLGQVQPDTRNPVLVTAMETLGEAENRYSGIPTIRAAMKKYSLPAPVFQDSRGSFRVILYHEARADSAPGQKTKPEIVPPNDEKGLVDFCQIPRTRTEIVNYLAIPSAQYTLRRYLDPLVQAGRILLELPEKPRSPKQRYIARQNHDKTGI